MRTCKACLVLTLCISAFISLPAFGKEGVHATVHTTIPALSEEGTQLEVSWTLADPKSGKPFNAGRVFIRLIGPAGDTTEAFGTDDRKSNGQYRAIVTVPAGGIQKVEIGIAGITTHPDGRTKRGDMILALANDPIRE